MTCTTAQDSHEIRMTNQIRCSKKNDQSIISSLHCIIARLGIIIIRY